MSLGKAYKYGTVQIVELKNISTSPFQVRKRYGKINELAKDIEQRGLLQPILVRPVDGGFEIVHGHRRWKAVKSLGRTHIESFVKDLTDTEAILIQGSENIQRKNYDPIEEGTLYKNYQKFMQKEHIEKISFQEIARTFNTSTSNVERKIGLLDLPENVQNKIIKGEVSFSKVRALLPLTKEPLPFGNGKFQVSQRTDKHFFEIQTLTNEIEKGSKGGLRTEKGISYAVGAIQKGKPIDDALEEAKLKESIEIAKKQAEQGKNPKEIIREIINSQQDPQAVLDATVTLNIENIKKLLESETLKCPYCGGKDLAWNCCGEKILNGDKNTKIHNFNE